MSDFDELYQEIILDHYRRPRGAARLDEVPEGEIHENPTCGDSLKLKVEYGPDGRIARVLHESRGCAISVASASMLTGAVAGLVPAEALSLAGEVEAALRGEGDDPRGFLEGNGELAALAGVAAFPARVKCASLAWRALESALAPPPGTDRGS
ncbi:MAG: SUF system NifU family Fe-S cluster assembly protein [Spirochaetia bacterium]|nr:SUF system NifU family Fe-S cluster assembly protein [Spirochaetia bacterium]